MEQRAENAADQRFCLNRMLGGEASPLMLMITNANPRVRAHDVSAEPMSRDDCRQVAAEVAELIGELVTCQFQDRANSQPSGFVDSAVAF